MVRIRLHIAETKHVGKVEQRRGRLHQRRHLLSTETEVRQQRIDRQCALFAVRSLDRVGGLDDVVKQRRHIAGILIA